MATKRFGAKARKAPKIKFQIENDLTGTDDEFEFAAPKLAGAMLPVLEGGGEDMTSAVWNWLRTGLGDDQYQTLRARLDDPADSLDVNEVGEIARWLVGEASGRPTGKRSV